MTAESIILCGMISVTTNVVMGCLLLVFWLRDRPGRWNLLWGIAYVTIAISLALWLLLHRVGPSPLLIGAAGVTDGIGTASLLAGVSAFLGRDIPWRLYYAGAITLCTLGNFLGSHYNLNFSVVGAALFLGMAHAWGGLRFVREPDRAAKTIGGLFLARAFQLFCFAPLTLAGYGGLAFLSGQFMTLATGFGMLCVAFIDYDRRLTRVSSELEARNAILEEKDRELTETNRTLSEMAVKLELQSVDYAAARDRAEAANQSKSQFLANMSHELRTPLNAVIGFSDMIRTLDDSSRATAKAREYANYVFDAGNHLLALVNDLLDIARIELNALEISRETFRIAESVDSALSLLTFPLKTKQISTRVDVPRDLHVNADPRLIKQVLTNLIGNAIKYSPAGTEIDIGVVVAGDNEIVLTVADRGPGIDPSERELVFQPFWQKADVHSRNQGGVGLGLSIVRLIIERHRGSIRIEDRPGGGAQVVVTLPIDIGES